MPKVGIGELNIEDMVDYMGKLLSEQFGQEITMKAKLRSEKSKNLRKTQADACRTGQAISKEVKQ